MLFYKKSNLDVHEFMQQKKYKAENISAILVIVRL